jgi:putative spermidine/putrescine transport system permease protein
MTTALLTTNDGKPLTVALRHSRARQKRRAFFLVAPLLLFIVATFIVPIGLMLSRSLHNDEFSSVAPNLGVWFDAHPAGTPPDEAAYEALVLDLRLMKAAKAQGAAGGRVNYDFSGARSLFTGTARKADSLAPPYAESVPAADKKWSDPLLWQAMRNASSAWSINFYLAALDLNRDAQGAIVPVDEKESIYRKLFLRTFVLAASIAAITLVLGYPVAHLLASLPLKWSNLLMIMVLLPFWTSLLVRTTAWIVLLQTEGVLNSTLVALGIVTPENRLPMMYNMVGTVVAMTHILLPFMILPLYSVMRTVNPSYVRAARSLGATSWTAFRRVYLPQTVPGIGAGVLLVFILAVGYYITPALVGGASGRLISNLIAEHMNDTLNWSLAAALSALLLAAVLVLYWLYDRLIGIDNLKLG